jgi:hypothetical protein
MNLMSTAPRRREPIIPLLENGDRLDQKTFHERYEATPEHVRAELIGGIVYMASPLRLHRGQVTLDLNWFLTHYIVATPGTDGADNPTLILGPESEPQPDCCLFIMPQVWRAGS